ncbi:hypothetical protein [Absidia glauca]|uniref:Uncharacterized protein n=1 Tax=Absidia glauca TaxID=4829 RepID=A0A168ML81_ABSGL|nr:hypothetical protein [Absidia glauca]
MTYVGYQEKHGGQVSGNGFECRCMKQRPLQLKSLGFRWPPTEDDQDDEGARSADDVVTIDSGEQILGGMRCKEDTEYVPILVKFERRLSKLLLSKVVNTLDTSIYAEMENIFTKAQLDIILHLDTLEYERKYGLDQSTVSLLDDIIEDCNTVTQFLRRIPLEKGELTGKNDWHTYRYRMLCIYGAHPRSSTIVMRHLAKLPLMVDRNSILQLKYIARSRFHPTDTLLHAVTQLPRQPPQNRDIDQTAQATTDTTASSSLCHSLHSPSVPSINIVYSIPIHLTFPSLITISIFLVPRFPLFLNPAGQITTSKSLCHQTADISNLFGRQIDLLLKMKDSSTEPASNEWKSHKSNHLRQRHQSRNLRSSCAILNKRYIESHSLIDTTTAIDVIGTTGYIYKLQWKDPVYVTKLVERSFLA